MRKEAKTISRNSIEALIPLGDKIYFLGHDASVFNNKELGEAEEKLREPLRRVIELLQQRGYFQQTVSSEWILNTLYALLFHTWEQVHEGNVAKKICCRACFKYILLWFQS